jgi:dCMP deaminase
LILQAGIRRVVFLDKYKDTEGIDFLQSAGVETIHLQPTDHVE